MSASSSEVPGQGTTLPYPDSLDHQRPEHRLRRWGMVWGVVTGAKDGQSKRMESPANASADGRISCQSTLSTCLMYQTLAPRAPSSGRLAARILLQQIA